jgi:tyrosine-specific transport protein
MGCILLIVGTTIGAGRLALPIATAHVGFIGSLLLLFGAWFVMTAGAFLLLEVNLWLPQNSHLISMAKATCGPIGQLAAWLSYLLLLYSMLAAYIAGGSDLLHNLTQLAGLPLSSIAAAVLFTLLFGFVVYLGIRTVDYVNRGLMIIKLGSYFLLVGLLTPFISPEKLTQGALQHITNATAVMVTIASFGFSAIVPSLRIYFAGDIKNLKRAILIGSMMPLLCYIAWDMVIMGIIPLEGEQGLIAVLHSGNSTSDLVNTLNTTVGLPLTSLLAKVFTSICVVTSFLGVTLCLVDFLADGLRIEKKGSGKVMVTVMTLLPINFEFIT